MEIQIFDNQTTEKTRTRRPPTPLTSLAEMKITAQFTIMTTKHMRLLSSTGGGAALLRWPSVADYLNIGTALPNFLLFLYFLLFSFWSFLGFQKS